MREKDRLRVLAISNERYALPHPVVDRMIEDRRTQLLEQSVVRVAVKEQEIESDRWQVVNAEVA